MIYNWNAADYGIRLPAAVVNLRISVPEQRKVADQQVGPNLRWTNTGGKRCMPGDSDIATPECNIGNVAIQLCIDTGWISVTSYAVN